MCIRDSVCWGKNSVSDYCGVQLRRVEEGEEKYRGKIKAIDLSTYSGEFRTGGAIKRKTAGS